MKTKYIYIFLLLFAWSSVSSQVRDNRPFKKGSMFLFWGWNRAWYSNSDIGFSGSRYKFMLHNVKAADRPTDFDLGVYFGPTKITLPQTNARVAYFVKDNLALVFAIDHMKYVMEQNQVVDFSGEIKNPYAYYVKDGKVDLSDGQFLTFEHTDGLNYVNLGLEKYNSLVNTKNVDIYWAYGGGIGGLYPKTNAKLFGNERSDRFHVAGFGADVRANLNLVLWKHFLARLEVKYGYINMFDIKTTLNNTDKAWQDFIFGQVNFGIGYTFNTKK
ncbi:hypothetical protein J5295_07240 [Riemerella anatipestifer]|nr:hypothetical protein [Riemerella anatipestifer]ADQ81881.1 hypothetical protein Riean_0717 [Riemerella anatipestifer ATCC 11845 = DSM 15868]ADZ12617.1 hypothetical protein RIA_1528 [Riemerella anatipestifer RA-GD]AKQ39474.1 hypothetical protein AS87_03870 [Riemerella anatipestifer Yb2]EFT36118.1 hypothetical protein RAYM_02302 [Riemerella anatipestifer RA-YM]AGC40205.1 hypothetical protein G148_0901 [Riemerella anatipestifer RA-CH-2]